MREVLIALSALAVVALLQGLFHTLGFMKEKEQEELFRRIQSEGGSREAERVSLLRRGKMARSAWLAALLTAVPKAKHFERLVQQAHVPITVAQLFVYSVILSVLAGTAALVAGGIVVGIAVAIVMFWVPSLVIVNKRLRRSQQLSEQLPDALEMVARSLRAGHALPSSFQLVAREMPKPICEEFAIAFEEQNLGATFDYAVMQMAERAPTNGDIKLFAVSVIIQKETGGNLVEILEKISETIRSRYRFYGKLRALTAEGRLSALVLGGLPFVTVLFVTVLNPGYLRPLFTQPLGKWFLIYAILAWAGGILWLRKMGKVEL
jgi:tight adherence protein B